MHLCPVNRRTSLPQLLASVPQNDIAIDEGSRYPANYGPNPPDIPVRERRRTCQIRSSYLGAYGTSRVHRSSSERAAHQNVSNDNESYRKASHLGGSRVNGRAKNCENKKERHNRFKCNTLTDGSLSAECRRSPSNRIANVVGKNRGQEQS